MTVSDTILAYPALEGIKLGLLSKVAIDRDLVLTAEYNKNLKQQVDLVAADLYREAALTPNYKDGDQSETFSPEWMNKRADEIYMRYGELSNVKNNILHGW